MVILGFNLSINSLDNRITVLEDRSDYTSDIRNINDSIVILQKQIDAITIPDYPSDISSINDSIVSLQSQIDGTTIPDYANDISSLNSKVRVVQDQINSLMIPPDSTTDIFSINDLISAMNQSIAELQNLIGDGNNWIYLRDINNSLTNLQDQTNSMNSP
jgi:hypothetical protein